MLHLRFALLVTVACLVASQEPEETTDVSSTSDNPGSTDMADVIPMVTDVGPGVQFDSTTDSADNATSTEEASTTDTTPGGGNATTPAPEHETGAASTLGLSAASLALLAVAVMS